MPDITKMKSCLKKAGYCACPEKGGKKKSGMKKSVSYEKKEKKPRKPRSDKGKKRGASKASAPKPSAPKARKKRSDAGKKRGSKSAPKAPAVSVVAKKVRKKRSDAGKKRGARKPKTSSAMVVRKKVKRVVRKKRGKSMPRLEDRRQRPLPPISQILRQPTGIPPPNAYMGKQIVPYNRVATAGGARGVAGRGATKARKKAKRRIKIKKRSSKTDKTLTNSDCNKKVRAAMKQYREDRKNQ